MSQWWLHGSDQKLKKRQLGNQGRSHSGASRRKKMRAVTYVRIGNKAMDVLIRQAMKGGRKGTATYHDSYHSSSW